MSRKSITCSRIHAALDRVRHKSNVSGYVVMNGAEHIGTVRLSYPRDGAGRLIVLAANWAAARPQGVEFTAWTPWQYGAANGCGYDKATAALSGMTIGTVTIKDDGWDWSRQLRDAGYSVIEAV